MRWTEWSGMAETDATGDDTGAHRAEYAACPRCGSRAVLPIRYGLRFQEYDVDTGEPTMALGGCVIQVGDPAWSCQSCGYRWGLSNDYGAMMQDAHFTGDIAADFDHEIVRLAVEHGDKSLPVPAHLSEARTADLFTRAGIHASERYRRAWRDQAIIAHIALDDGNGDCQLTVGEVMRIVASETQ